MAVKRGNKRKNSIDPESIERDENTTRINDEKKRIRSALNRDVNISAKNVSQKDLIKSILRNEITICSGPAGTGKAQPLDSLILTENGYVRMGNINIGDKIFGKNGKLTKVNGVFYQGKREAYLVTFSDGSKVECCDEHLWLTYNDYERNYLKNSRGTIKTLSEININYKNKSNKLKYSIPIVDAIEFKKKKLLVDPYLLGVLLGDGSLTTTIRISSSDKQIINECDSRLPNDYFIKKIKSSKYDYSILNKISNKKYSYRKYINELKLNGIKSENKFIPNNYLYSSINDRIELLQGLMDSDGTVDKKSGTLSFTSTSKELILNLKFIIESLGGVINPIKEKVKKYKYKNEIKLGRISYSMSFRLPNKIIPFKLNRKKGLFKNKTKYFPVRYIKNIEFIGKKEMKCISVEANDNLYITNNFIITHNTFISLALALGLLRAENNKFLKIYLVKSVTTLKGEEIGFLKGDLNEKIEPFIWSFVLNVEKLLPDTKIKSLMENDFIRPFPLAYARGASIDNAIIIADEVQNISIGNMRTLMTRIGEDSKMILLGDSNQIDLRNKDESSLDILLNMFKNVEEIGCISMNDKDVNIRNPIINKIEDKFKEHNDEKIRRKSK